MFKSLIAQVFVTVPLYWDVMLNSEGRQILFCPVAVVCLSQNSLQLHFCRNLNTSGAFFFVSRSKILELAWGMKPKLTRK